jgi:epoxyqueuosine reductase
MIAIGNSDDGGLLPIAAARLADGSPLVRAMAVWAARRLADDATFAALAAAQADEPDPAVREEWD